MTGQGVTDDRALKEGVNAPRPACTECQRRKQKCNREWPCNHCLRRKVGDTCRFSYDTQPNSAWTASQDIKRKREASSGYAVDELDDGADGLGLEAMGYTTSHLLATLDLAANENAGPEEYRAHVDQCPQLLRALQALPPRSYIDSLVQNFLNNVNFYYYILYPPSFQREYHEWWEDRNKDRPLGLSWTCLLIMVCSCSIQHADAELRHRHESDLGATALKLSDTYHSAARELHAAVPLGHSQLSTVQYLLHSCYWYKAEARFTECWDILGAAAREAQKLGLHKEPDARISNFDREMRRRLWIIVDSWDWLVSALLARPMLIDRSDSQVGPPSLTLEDYPTSPLLHMKLQSDLVARIFARFGPPRLFTDPAEIAEYKTILDAFMASFPPAYAFDDPDTRHEAKHPWIALHRHYMHTCTLSITLGPFRGYMVKTVAADSPDSWRRLRADGVGYALRLMRACRAFFEYVWARDTTFHFVPFCIFDTAALLCSAVLHDSDGSLPRRGEVLDAVELAQDTLGRLRTATATAKAPDSLLRRLRDRVHYFLGASADGPRKRSRVAPVGSKTGGIVIPGAYATDVSGLAGSSAAYAVGGSSGSGNGNGNGYHGTAYEPAPQYQYQYAYAAPTTAPAVRNADQVDIFANEALGADGLPRTTANQPAQWAATSETRGYNAQNENAFVANNDVSHMAGGAPGRVYHHMPMASAAGPHDGVPRWSRAGVDASGSGNNDNHGHAFVPGEGDMPVAYSAADVPGGHGLYSAVPEMQPVYAPMPMPMPMPEQQQQQQQQQQQHQQVPVSAEMQLQVPPVNEMGTAAEMGDLAAMWHWQGLDLGFQSNPLMPASSGAEG